MGAKLSSEVRKAVEYWQKTTVSVPQAAKRFNVHHTSVYRAIVRMGAKRIPKA